MVIGTTWCTDTHLYRPSHFGKLRSPEGLVSPSSSMARILSSVWPYYHVHPWQGEFCCRCAFLAARLCGWSTSNTYCLTFDDTNRPFLAKVYHWRIRNRSILWQDLKCWKIYWWYWMEEQSIIHRQSSGYSSCWLTTGRSFLSRTWRIGPFWFRQIICITVKHVLLA